MENLFKFGKFTLNSGKEADWKIECDALTDADWDCLAKIAVRMLPSFGEVHGIPRGGLKLAQRLEPYAT